MISQTTSGKTLRVSYWQDGSFFFQILKLLEVEVKLIIICKQLLLLAVAKVAHPDSSASKMSMKKYCKHVNPTRSLSTQSLARGNQQHQCAQMQCNVMQSEDILINALHVLSVYDKVQSRGKANQNVKLRFYILKSYCDFYFYFLLLFNKNIF